MTCSHALIFCAAFVITFSILFLFSAILDARKKHRATTNATIDDIQKAIGIWDKWSYDLLRKQFVFFTCYYSDEEAQLYKPKAWYNANFATFIKIVKRKDNLNNYTLHTSWH